MSRVLATRKEFGFGPSFFIAVFIHAGVATLLYYSSLNAAAPPPQPPAPPLQIRFVKVPQETMTMSPQSGTPHPAPAPALASPGSHRAGGAMNAARAAAAQAEKLLSQGYEGMPDSRPVRNPDVQVPNGRNRMQEYPGLSTSLQHLDRYISPGGGTGSGSGNSGGSGHGTDAAAGAYFDTQGYDLGPWGDQVVALVKRNWSIPPAADLGMKGVVSVAFNVNRNGRLEDLRIISSSGIPSFDQAAVNALKISDPFVPLPTDFPRPKLPAIFRFFYNVPVPK